MAATTYPISGGRAGQSAVVSETTARTYGVAMPAVLQESGTSGGGGGGGGGGTAAQAFAMVLA